MLIKLIQSCDRITESIHKVQKFLLVILCVAITIINLLQVAGRYLFHYSLPWSEPYDSFDLENVQNFCHFHAASC